MSEFKPRSLGLLIACIVLLAVGPAGLLFNTFSLFLSPMADEIHWTDATLSSLVLWMALGIAVSSPIRGLLVDRYGVRVTTIPSIILLSVTTAFIGVLPRTYGPHWPTCAAFFLAGVFGPGNVPAGKVLAQWFSDRRGIAYGLLGFGYAASIPASLHFAHSAIDLLGWRSAYLAFGCVQLVLGLPAAGFLLSERSSRQFGRHTDRRRTGPQDSTVWQAMATWDYWLVVVTLCLGVCVVVAVVTHGVPLLVARGLSRAQATEVLSFLGVGGAIAQPLLGVGLDRLQTPRIVVPFCLLAAVGAWLLATSSSILVLSLGMFLLGLGASGESGTTQFLVARYFGLTSFSTVYGTVQPFYLIFGVGVGSAAFGLLAGVGYGYSQGLIAAALTMLASGILTLGFAPFRKPGLSYNTPTHTRTVDEAASCHEPQHST